MKLKWLEKKHEIKAEVGIVEKDEDDGMTLLPNGCRLIKRWCPDCNRFGGVKFPIVCVCGGLIHNERIEIDCYDYYDHEFKFECTKCGSTYSESDWSPAKRTFAKMGMLFRKNLIMKELKEHIKNPEVLRKIIEHLDKIYYNAPKINYSGFK